MRMFKRGDVVTVEGRIYGARVIQTQGGDVPSVRVSYHDPQKGQVTRWVPLSAVSK